MQVVRQSEGVVLSVGDGIATISGLYGASLYDCWSFRAASRVSRSTLTQR